MDIKKISEVYEISKRINATPKIKILDNFIEISKNFNELLKNISIPESLINIKDEINRFLKDEYNVASSNIQSTTFKDISCDQYILEKQLLLNNIKDLLIKETNTLRQNEFEIIISKVHSNILWLIKNKIEKNKSNTNDIISKFNDGKDRKGKQDELLKYLESINENNNSEKLSCKNTTYFEDILENIIIGTNDQCGIKQIINAESVYFNNFESLKNIKSENESSENLNKTLNQITEIIKQEEIKTPVYFENFAFKNQEIVKAYKEYLEKNKNHKEILDILEKNSEGENILILPVWIGKTFKGIVVLKGKNMMMRVKTRDDLRAIFYELEKIMIKKFPDSYTEEQSEYYFKEFDSNKNSNYEIFEDIIKKAKNIQNSNFQNTNDIYIHVTEIIKSIEKIQEILGEPIKDLKSFEVILSKTIESKHLNSNEEKEIFEKNKILLELIFSRLIKLIENLKKNYIRNQIGELRNRMLEEATIPNNINEWLLSIKKENEKIKLNKDSSEIKESLRNSEENISNRINRIKETLPKYKNDSSFYNKLFLDFSNQLNDIIKSDTNEIFIKPNKKNIEFKKNQNNYQILNHICHNEIKTAIYFDKEAYNKKGSFPVYDNYLSKHPEIETLLAYINEKFPNKEKILIIPAWYGNEIRGFSIFMKNNNDLNFLTSNVSDINNLLNSIKEPLEEQFHYDFSLEKKEKSKQTFEELINNVAIAKKFISIDLNELYFDLISNNKWKEVIERVVKNNKRYIRMLDAAKQRGTSGTIISAYYEQELEDPNLDPKLQRLYKSSILALSLRASEASLNYETIESELDPNISLFDNYKSIIFKKTEKEISQYKKKGLDISIKDFNKYKLFEKTFNKAKEIIKKIGKYEDFPDSIEDRDYYLKVFSTYFKESLQIIHDTKVSKRFAIYNDTKNEYEKKLLLINDNIPSISYDEFIKTNPNKSQDFWSYYEKILSEKINQILIANNINLDSKSIDSQFIKPIKSKIIEKYSIKIIKDFPVDNKQQDENLKILNSCVKNHFIDELKKVGNNINTYKKSEALKILSSSDFINKFNFQLQNVLSKKSDKTLWEQYKELLNINFINYSKEIEKDKKAKIPENFLKRIKFSNKIKKEEKAKKFSNFFDEIEAVLKEKIGLDFDVIPKNPKEQAERVNIYNRAFQQTLSKFNKALEEESLLFMILAIGLIYGHGPNSGDDLLKNEINSVTKPPNAEYHSTNFGLDTSAEHYGRKIAHCIQALIENNFVNLSINDATMEFFMSHYLRRETNKFTYNHKIESSSKIYIVCENNDQFYQLQNFSEITDSLSFLESKGKSIEFKKKENRKDIDEELLKKIGVAFYDPPIIIDLTHNEFLNITDEQTRHVDAIRDKGVVTGFSPKTSIAILLGLAEYYKQKDKSEEQEKLKESPIIGELYDFRSYEHKPEIFEQNKGWKYKEEKDGKLIFKKGNKIIKISGDEFKKYSQKSTNQ